MHGFLWLKPRTSLPPAYDIQYGSMIAAGIEYNRYRKLARASPLPSILRGWIALSPRVSNPSVTRTIEWVPTLTRTQTSDGFSFVQNYGTGAFSGFTFAIATTTTTRRNRDEPITFTTTDPFTLPGAGARPIPNELFILKL
jgi:hypothetical protein